MEIKVVCFKYEEDGFIVYFVEDDPIFFHIDYHFYSFDEQEENNMLVIANELNWHYKYSRLLLDEENCIFVRTAICATDDFDIRDIRDLFWTAFDSTLAAARNFKIQANTRKDISLN